MTSIQNNNNLKVLLLLIREIEFIYFDITNVMLTKLNYQNLIVKNQNAGHRKLWQNKKKEGRYRIEIKIQNGYLNS